MKTQWPNSYSSSIISVNKPGQRQSHIWNAVVYICTTCLSCNCNLHLLLRMRGKCVWFISRPPTGPSYFFNDNISSYVLTSERDCHNSCSITCVPLCPAVQDIPAAWTRRLMGSGTIFEMRIIDSVGHISFSLFCLQQSMSPDEEKWLEWFDFLVKHFLLNWPPLALRVYAAFPDQIKQTTQLKRARAHTHTHGGTKKQKQEQMIFRRKMVNIASLLKANKKCDKNSLSIKQFNGFPFITSTLQELNTVPWSRATTNYVVILECHLQLKKMDRCALFDLWVNNTTLCL